MTLLAGSSWRPAALAALLLALVPRAGTAAPPLLHLLDDQGRPVEEALTLCFQIELRNDCSQLLPGQQARGPERFSSLRVEGADHGPITLHRESLTAQADGSFRIAVPRKAFLRVERPIQQPLTVSLYSPKDATFREPAFRATLAAGEAAIKVPAGVYIASLAMPPHAPDLHRLEARPAERVRLAHRARRGWSLVLRCRSAATAQPVSAVDVQVSEAFGYGLPEKVLASSPSGSDGLVLLSGLGAPMAGVSARHPGFLPASIRGLTASPGSFAFREVALAAGGRLRARVSIHGRPLAEARCQVFELAPLPPDAPLDREPYRVLWEGPVDRQGLCRSDLLAEGSYKLRVRIPQSTATVNRWVSVVEGQETEEDVALAPARVRGEIRRDGKPLAGYSVEAMLLAADLPKGARADISAEATSDEEGRYELTLWAPGWYSLHLRSPARTIVAGRKELTVEGDEEHEADFDLQPASFRGTVVDQKGRPVEGARVALRWAGAMITTTDAEGRFEIGVQGEGTGTLSAFKAGYTGSDSVDVAVAADVTIPPVTLVLKEKSAIRGTVLSAAGRPVAGAWVASIGSALETGPFLYRSAWSGADGAFEVEAPPGSARVFVSGPSCPLARFDLPGTDATMPPAESADGAPAPPLRCPAAPAALSLMISDELGRPLANAGLILRRQGAVVPQQVLAAHLQLLGLPAVTDGAGNIVLANLDPGDYDLFLNGFSSESTVAAGSPMGYLTSVSLPSFATTELQLTLPSTR